MAALPHGCVDLALIVQAIRRSPIRIMGLMPTALTRRYALLDLPRGYDPTDVIILDWIAAEASRTHRNLFADLN
jgi:hypothetical protein